jgi:hypothetical protein
MNTPDFLQDTINLVKSIETRFLELGARLYTIKDKEMWKDNYESFQDFLIDAKINPGNASILVSIHKNYAVEGGVPQEKLAGIGYSTLYEAIPLIEKRGVTEVVEMARTLTRTEIKDEVRESKHGECTHEIITICGKCKKRVYEAK